MFSASTTLRLGLKWWLSRRQYRILMTSSTLLSSIHQSIYLMMHAPLSDTAWWLTKSRVNLHSVPHMVALNYLMKTKNLHRTLIVQLLSHSVTAIVITPTEKQCSTRVLLFTQMYKACASSAWGHAFKCEGANHLTNLKLAVSMMSTWAFKES